LQSVSSEESVPLFELSESTSTVSSENGVYPLRSSEGDVPDNDSLEDSENEVIIVTDESVFVEPQVSSILETFLVRVRLLFTAAFEFVVHLSFVVEENVSSVCQSVSQSVSQSLEQFELQRMQ